MTKDTKYKIKVGISLPDYQALILSIYKDYQTVIKSKIQEYEKTFSSDNPFFKYGKGENYFIFDNEKVVGHISAIIDERFGEIGTIGFFECENNQEYSDLLFEKANNFLKEGGKIKSRGPINITVWQNFRASYPESNSPYFLEPFTREYYRDLFLKNDYTVNYKSVTTIDLIDMTKISGYEIQYLQSIEKGYNYELLNTENAKESISNIYTLTHQIFAESYSFYKISEEEFQFFTKQYAEWKEPHYIFILKDKNKELVGFFFAMPDLYNPLTKRVVLKTMGIVPKYRGLGLAEAMFYFIYKNLKRDGFNELMYSTRAVGNDRIKSLTGEDLNIYRNYEVYEKELI